MSFCLKCLVVSLRLAFQKGGGGEALRSVCLSSTVAAVVISPWGLLHAVCVSVLLTPPCSLTPHSHSNSRDVRAPPRECVPPTTPPYSTLAHSDTPTPWTKFQIRAWSSSAARRTGRPQRVIVRTPCKDGQSIHRTFGK